MTGGAPEPQQHTLEPAAPVHIDHDSHFSWTHAYMFPVYGMVAVALIAGAVKLYLNRGKK